METTDDIWAGDLFDRRVEAEALVAYLESVAARPAIREDGHAHVLAVDGQYGEGKSYFLRRFARHMRLTHPVAFVDAWVDDLEDEPLVALASTLEEALEPYRQDAQVADRLKAFREKAGRVSKIVAGGLVKRGIGLLITQAAADLLSDELANGVEVEKDINKDSLKDAGKGLVDEAATALMESATPAMEERIAQFREGKEAVQAMKMGLSAVVARLTELNIPTPITIVIDELDRCRPTYAIKLLEEVKHLFDVPGVAFVLGLHAGQLTHSISAAYGSGFNAQAYLRRFFNRRYSMRPAKLDALIELLMQKLSIPTNRLEYPPIRFNRQGRSVEWPPHRLIADVMRASGLTARDAFELMEMLQTAMALAPGPVQLAYLLPLMIARMRGTSGVVLVEQELPWTFISSADPFARDITDVTWNDLARGLHEAAKWPDRRLTDAYNGESPHLSVKIAAQNSFGNAEPSSYQRFGNYEALLAAVSRFS